MHRRHYRRMAGLFAVLAMILSLAEAGIASMCAPMAGQPNHAFDDEARTGDDCMMAMRAAADEDADERSPQHCPFGPAAAAQTCTAAVSLPATVSRIGEATTVTVAAGTFDDIQNDLLLDSGLFHPPKA